MGILRNHLLLNTWMFTLLCVFAADAKDLTEIAKEARSAYVTAQKRWQIGLADLVIGSNPDLEVIATAQRDLQLAYIELATARFDYLLEHDPSRIELTKGLSAFLNFHWSSEDSVALKRTDPSYANLERRVSELKKRNRDLPDWGKFRDFFADAFSKSKEYKALLKEFEKETKEIERLLEQYASKQ